MAETGDMMVRAGEVETPSGKGAADENFPVGSFLLPAHLRPHVACFYAFARAIDDIADAPELSPAEKIRRLQDFDRALSGAPGFGAPFEKAHALRRSLRETGVSTDHGSHLIAAFVQDCRKNRYANWEELLGYCALSANPVGRYLLDLHKEDPAHYPSSDALCTVLQIINHLQDCGDDKRDLDRVYIIEQWLREEGAGVADLDQPFSSPGLRRVMDRMLDGCEKLMTQARRLPGLLSDRRLAMESAIIVKLAARLMVRLRKGDPLAQRVALTKFDFFVCGLNGVAEGFFSAGRGVSDKRLS